MKSVKFNTLTSLVMAAALAIGLTACGSSSTTPEPEPEPVPVPIPEPTPPSDLEVTQADAADAAAAAMMASDAAAEAASGAAEATMNIATRQTGGMAAKAAMDAGMYADMAKAEADKASAAAAAAAAATTGSEAEAAWSDAVAAQEAAEAAAMMADEKAKAAVAAVMTELHIDDKTKSVGDSTLTIKDGDPTIDTGAGTAASPRSVTGGLGDIRRAGAMVDAAAVSAFNDNSSDSSFGDTDADGILHSSPGRVDNANTTKDESEPYIQAIAARTGANAPKIGVVYDSEDDMARLWLIHSYRGTEMAYAYQQGAGATAGTTTMSGHVTITDSDGALTTGAPQAGTSSAVRLTLVGEFYRAGDATTAGTELTHSLVVGATAKPLKVYSYTATVDGTAQTFYVVEDDTTVDPTAPTATQTTYSYLPVDITVQYWGPASTTTDDDDTIPAADRMRRATVAIPKAMEYKHIHFGIWAGLGEAATRSGAQDIADLGIGFVQNISGGGMTADVPSHGSATFTGDWAAAVESSGGLIVLNTGGASVTANFDKATVTASLTGLARLTGTLDGSTFAGTAASRIAHANLNANAAFAGTFSGGLYGAGATEAGGVFDFAETGGGAFRGAFGGQRKLTP